MTEYVMTVFRKLSKLLCDLHLLILHFLLMSIVTAITCKCILYHKLAVHILHIVCGRFSRIQQKLSLDKTDPFVGRLHCYWTLKRRSRNGAPLLRSMLFSFAHLARQRLLVTGRLHVYN